MSAQAPSPVPAPQSSLQRYLDKAVAVLQKFGALSAADVPNELIRLLDEVKHVDEPKALAIAKSCPAAAWCTVEVRETGPCYIR